MIVRARASRGQAVIEMALTLPLLLLIVFGIFDFGFMFQRYEVVTNAAREGARLGSLTQSAGYTASEARQRALDYLLASGIAGTVVASGTDCMALSEVANQTCVSVTYSTATIPATATSPPKSVDQVTVVAQYDHQHTYVGPILTLFGGSMDITRLRAISTMRRE